MPKTAAKAVTLNVSIGARFRKLTDDLVKSGRYGSASEVVRAAMRLLEEEERETREAVAAMRRGLADVEAGRMRPAAEVLADVRREILKHRRR